MRRIAASSTPISSASSKTSCSAWRASAWFSASTLSFSRQETGLPSAPGHSAGGATLIAARAAAGAGWSLPRCWFISVTLKMKRPSRLSRLTALWVMVISPPSRRMRSEPPGTRAMYLPPSSPSLWISAEVSLGSRSVGSTRSVSTARKVSGSIRWPATWPTLTPATRISAPAASPSMRSNRAVRDMPAVVSARPLPVTA